jgi:tetrahydromethanopterin S-methyltransferase subunit B
VAATEALAPVAVTLNSWCRSAVVHWLPVQFVTPVNRYSEVIGLLVAAQVAVIVAVVPVLHPSAPQLVSPTVSW